jgi:prolyl-tRNA editing enzyme YbaK/EbsC (Cys-tRNA(Pro) deacylase)
MKLVVADPAFVLASTGFAAGGVSPVGLAGPVSILVDEDLLALDPVWAAAGSPQHVFRTSAAEIVRMTGAVAAPVRVV